MSAIRGVLPSQPFRRHRGSPSGHSWSAPLLCDQASRASTSVSTLFAVCDYHSLGSLVQSDDSRSSYIVKGGRVEVEHVEQKQSMIEEYAGFQYVELKNYRKEIEKKLLCQPVLGLSSHKIKEISVSRKHRQLPTRGIGAATECKDQHSCKVSDFPTPFDVLSLAEEALIASREASVLAKISEDCIGIGKETIVHSLDNEELTIVRSSRSVERKLKNRKLPKTCHHKYGLTSQKNRYIERKIGLYLDSDDPLKLFMRGLEAKKLLTPEEEKSIFRQIQELLRLQEIRCRLKSQYDREPTLTEWAETVGMTSRDLQSFLSSSMRSRDKIIYANFRLVVHIAKQYTGMGLGINDLLQEGSRGLLKSLEKFKPLTGCRFPTYAYWWIRQSIRKAIFQHSRTIRIPENLFTILKKLRSAKALHTRLGRQPALEDMASHAGVSVERLENILKVSRRPISFQKRVGSDEDATFQEITADPDEDIPDVTVAKAMLRQHLCEFLDLLKPRERMIIEHRFGMGGTARLSLREIGELLGGLTKERVRQLESHALEKLKEALPSHVVVMYRELLM